MCFIAVPIPAFAYHTETQTPYDITNVLNSNDGSITVSWQESDGLEDNQPEYYIVYIGLSETADDVSEQTKFGFTEALSWQSYTFTAQYLYDELAVDNQKIYAKVKAFHDTNGTTSDFTPVESIMYNFVYTPTTTTSSSTTSSTTTTSTTSTVPNTTTTSSTSTSSTTSSTTTSSTTTTTTTLPPPPPPTTTTTLAPVIVKIGGEEVEYTQSEVDDGTVDRDIERQGNEDKWGCYITNIALERGDCPAYNDSLKQEEEKEEVIIEIKDEKFTDTETELLDDDVVVLEVESNDEIKDIEDELVEEIIEEEIKIDNKELEEEFKFEEEEIIIEIPEKIIIIIEEDVEEEVIQDELDEEIFTDDTESEKEIQKEDEVFFEEVEITEEQIQEEVKQVEEKIKAIQENNVKELETEQVVEIIEEVNDAGLENLAEVSEDVLEVVAEVVEQSIAKADELTQEQQEVVAEVLGFTETKDVEVLAKAVKTDKTVAKAVEEYVERAVQNADVENYTLADAQTEITFESLVAGDFSVIIDIDLDAIDLANISNDMTQDTKEKAQEVILPTVIVNIVSFVRRFN